MHVFPLVIKAYEVSLNKYKQNVQRLQAELDSTKHDKEELMKEFDSYKQETQEKVAHLTLSIQEKEQVIAELEKKLRANQEEFKNLQQKSEWHSFYSITAWLPLHVVIFTQWTSLQVIRKCLQQVISKNVSTVSVYSCLQLQW